MGMYSAVFAVAMVLAPVIGLGILESVVAQLPTDPSEIPDAAG